MDKIKEGESQKREDAGARKGKKVTIHCVFPMIWGSRGSKTNLAKAAGAEPAGQMRDENCTPLWRKAHFQVKMYKTGQHRSTFGSADVQEVHAVVARAHFQVKMYKAHHVRTTFGSSAVGKVHAVVARITCPSQNVQNTPCSDHFWKLRCRKKVHPVVARSIFPSQRCKKLTVSDLFWKLRCRKSARRCGAKHISKSKV